MRKSAQLRDFLTVKPRVRFGGSGSLDCVGAGHHVHAGYQEPSRVGTLLSTHVGCVVSWGGHVLEQGDVLQCGVLC